MIRAVALLLTAAPAFADTVVVTGSTVTLQETAQQGAVAEIVFENIQTNSQYDNGTYHLSFEGMEVPFRFGWNVDASGSDAIMVEPPEGTYCVPSCGMNVDEGNTGIIYLFVGDWEGV